MPELFAQAEIAAPASEVWALLADFGNIQAWWPRDGALQIERVEIEGEGIGMVRHIYNRGVAQCASERLDLLDPQTGTLVLSIVGQRPGGMTAYVATSRLVPLGDHACRMEHRALVTTVPGREAAVARFLQQAYAMMFAGLQAAAGRAGGAARP
jgi:Polyketide cyclase / dehydrase and lipid transport